MLFKKVDESKPATHPFEVGRHGGIIEAAGPQQRRAQDASLFEFLNQRKMM
jgi:hypothetical protein